MKYAKPEMNLVGNAASLIQAQKVADPIAEGLKHEQEIQSAYEPEE
jgi:hypothetical protein